MPYCFAAMSILALRLSSLSRQASYVKRNTTTPLLSLFTFLHIAYILQIIPLPRNDNLPFVISL
jgi:hypothetical protein